MNIRHNTMLGLGALLGLVPIVVGHVSLTFPAARNYPLDFLDSARTKSPCGMPKGKLLFHVSV